MTKADLMDHFDDIVTDDRLRLEVVEVLGLLGRQFPLLLGRLPDHRDAAESEGSQRLPPEQLDAVVK